MQPSYKTGQDFNAIFFNFEIYKADVKLSMLHCLPSFWWWSDKFSCLTYEQKNLRKVNTWSLEIVNGHGCEELKVGNEYWI